MAHDNHRSQDSTGETRIVDSYELSPTQEGMLFHDLLGGETGIDLEQIVWTITGAFDEQPLIAAFQQVVSRHPILRTRFRHDADGRPVQEVVEAVEIPVERLDLTRDERPDTSCRFEEALALDRARGIDLSRAPAMRLTIVDWSENEHRVVWTFHHALLDGRSFPLVLREVFAFQDAAEAGEALDLPGPRPYREYIEFLRELDLTSAEDYWRTFLAGFTAPTPLVIDHPAGGEARPVPIQGISEQRLSRETTTTLREFAASRSVTLNTLLQAAWAIVLHRHSGESDVVFGATRACRHSAFPDADEMVGLFINTLPVRVQVDPDGFIDDLLKEVRSIQIGLREHEHTPLAKVQGWSEVPRGRPLFDTIVVYENRTIDATLRAFDGHGPRLGFSYHGQTNYPLTLVAYGDDQMLIRLENDRRRVADAPAVRMLGHLVKVLTALPGYSGRRVGELPLLSDGERAALLSSLAVSGFAADRCLHERFEERARMCPGRVAVVCDGVSLSYGELERRANGVALRLRSLGVERGVLVALRMERSLDLVVGILGILKAGGAYLPLDPGYPKERVEFMLADSRVRVVVTESAFASDFGDSATQLLLLDEERGEAEQGPPGEVTPDDLAYVIYTSGSTGKPKGVLISHYNVTRLFDATEGWFEFGEDDVWTLFHSYAFDFSVWEMWGALLYGGRLVVVPYWVSRSPDDFRELLLREGVSVLNQTPSAFRQLLQADVNAGAPVQTNLRYVIFGGEALELQSLRPWFERHGEQQPKLVNMYGITETTVHVTYRPITLHDLEGGAGSVIGTPIPDLRVVLLDAQGALAPIGVPAEMYVGGAGVSRGYLERPELTSERFVPDTFAADAGAKLYRTGDLARRLENGDLEYLGRIDDQVKLRGFRIELGEIEAVLAEHAGVSDCAVLVREDAPGDKRLVAYLVGQGEGLLEELKAQLKTQLPEYMVPAHIVLLPTLPLTPNGKLDRKALPEPDPEALTSGTPYVAPRTPTEETLAEIWTDALGVASPSVHDDFFDLGGHSLKAAQIVTAIRSAFHVNAAVRHLLAEPTIAGLAEIVDLLAGTAAVTERASGSGREEVETRP